MRIEKYTNGKWYCSDSVIASDGDPVIRYLHHDGSWKKISDFFDTEKEIEQLLLTAQKPDFSLSENDLYWRQQLRADMERDMAQNDPYEEDDFRSQQWSEAW